MYTSSERSTHSPATTSAFLKDVLLCTLGAYGGPEAHMSVYLDQMVKKKGYLTETELVELIALCSTLPGPTSTQTIVSIGYKTGGPKLALLTMAVWSLPALAAMTALSFLYGLFQPGTGSPAFLQFVPPMAVGFIVVAAVRIGRKVAVDPGAALLLAAGAGVTLFVRTPWVFPLLLVAGGATVLLFSRERQLWNPVSLRPQWRYLLLFIFFTAGGIVLAAATGSLLPALFERFYRFGYLVFGGGQVVVPFMFSELVEGLHYLTGDQFLTGYGLVQGVPGPLFSFAAYAGGMAAAGGSTLDQLLGAAAGGLGIFLPGLLLIFFVYPLWEDIQRIRAVRIALKGVNAVAGGFIAASAVVLMRAGGIGAEEVAVAALSAGLLYFTRIPAPLIVLGALGAGVIAG